MTRIRDDDSPPASGRMPGDDAARRTPRRVRVVLGELRPDLPHLPELPGRGAGARRMTGRALARRRPTSASTCSPPGWRLTDAAGRRPPPGAQPARPRTSTRLEEQAQGYAGAFKIQVAGPWTLAATVERPRGDKVLADHGARRELAQALAEGVRGHVADVRRRLPRRRPAGGPGRRARAARRAGRRGADRVRLRPAPHGAPARGERRARLGARARSATPAPSRGCTAARAGTPARRCCAAPARRAWRSTSTWSARPTTTQLAEALEAGETVVLGVVPTTSRRAADRRQVTERVLRWLDMLGLDPASGPGWSAPPAGWPAPTRLGAAGAGTARAPGSRSRPARARDSPGSTGRSDAGVPVSRRGRPPGRRSRARRA